MDKKLLRDAQLRIADARSCVQAILDNTPDELTEGSGTLLEEIVDTLDELDGSIEKLIAEEAQTD